MSRIFKITSERKFQAHLLSFLLMIVPPIFMFYAAANNAFGWVWFLIGLVIIGNLLAILTR